MNVHPTPLNPSFEAAKAALLKEFEALILAIPQSAVIAAAKLKGEKAVAVVLKKPARPMSIQARNEIALAQMKADALQGFQEAYDALEASDVCAILGVTKQALSKKTRTGSVVAYTHNRRRYYPDFQFRNGRETPVIGHLIKQLGIDPADESLVNVLVLFLAQPMDFSEPGVPAKWQPRYLLLEHEAAFDIILRDFRNRLGMGK